ncbi:hypothetical protein [Allostreptomyces psammosilenae]|uniref:Uncharacterized protein n=1 Tax=Allostreptomyces psammosilenae TaxID=1892865 RepID=A0A852ZUE3_9ACTN|nr:hypothetical protein [Allostreptomyces psammosilenae]NYI06013.1 hypothetical protein [Allostreptomyces psammosilenae]
MTRTLALVESPAQLLNLLEWACAGGPQGDPAAAAPRGAAGSAPGALPGPRVPAPPSAGGSPVEAAVLLPRDPATREQLAAVARLARGEGVRVTPYDVRAGAAGLLRSGSALLPRLLGARRLVIGDPFSGLIQRLLPLSRARDVVLVDDGTATMELVPLLAEGRPLVRWHRDGVPPRAAVAAARRLSPGAGGDGGPVQRVELFSSLTPPPPPGITVTENRFTWTRRRFAAPRVEDRVDLIGSSLAETGVVDTERYLDGVRALAERLGADRYFAHRRERPDKLERIAAAGLEVVRPDLPLELVARRGPVAATVVSFPSTVVHTLPMVLADSPVKVLVCDIDPGWLSPSASNHVRDFLTRIAATARERHGLESVPVGVAGGS